MIAVLVLVINQVFIQFSLAKKRYDANTINLSGRQRMLSQKINLECYRLFSGKSSAEALNGFLSEWKAAHQALSEGSDTVEAVRLDAVLPLMATMTAQIAYTEEFINTIETKTAQDLEALDRNQERFLQNMDQVVNLLQQSSDDKLQSIVLIEILLMMLSIIVIILEVFLIYRPIEQKLRTLLQKIRFSEYYIKSTYNKSNLSVSFIDKEYNIQYINQAGIDINKRVFGREVQEGDNAMDFVLPELQSETKALYDRVLQGETIEYQRTHENRWYNFTLTPVRDKNGNIEGIAHQTEETTEQVRLHKENESLNKRIQLIANNLPNGAITLLDMNQTILYTNNPKLVRLMQQAKDQNILAKCMGPANYRTLMKQIELMPTGQHKEVQIELEGRHMLIRLQPVVDNEGTIENVILISTDITDLVLFQNEILDQNKRLSLISWRQSHELRGPLAAIQGLISLINLEKEKQINHEYLGYLKHACRKLDAIVHHIVKLSSGSDYVHTGLKSAG